MDIEAARSQMISQQLRPWEVLEPRVLEVMAGVPREAFVPEVYHGLAFADAGIPIGHGQIMLPPRVQGRLLQALAPGAGDSVLDVGTGTGFLAACLARLAGHVHSVDIEADFAAAARERIAPMGLGNLRLEVADAMTMAFPRKFDCIAVTAALPVYDPRFQDALAPGGRLFVVVGEAPVREALLIRRTGDKAWSRSVLFETDIPPMKGAPVPEPFIF